MTSLQQLLDDILSNVNSESLREFLEIQCGFSGDEAAGWIEEALEQTDCYIDSKGFFQQKDPYSSPMAEMTEPEIPADRLCELFDCQPQDLFEEEDQDNG